MFVVITMNSAVLLHPPPPPPPPELSRMYTLNACMLYPVVCTELESRSQTKVKQLHSNENSDVQHPPPHPPSCEWAGGLHNKHVSVSVSLSLSLSCFFLSFFSTEGTLSSGSAVPPNAGKFAPTADRDVFSGNSDCSGHEPTATTVNLDRKVCLPRQLGSQETGLTRLFAQSSPPTRRSRQTARRSLRHRCQQCARHYPCSKIETCQQCIRHYPCSKIETSSGCPPPHRAPAPPNTTGTALTSRA